MPPHIYQTLKPLITEPARSVLTLHRSPDGDSIGSNLALARILQQHGHTVSIYSIDPIPPFLQFLDGWDSIITAQPEEIRFDQYDRYWALDMATPSLVGGDTAVPSDTQTIVIDHHISNDSWGDLNLVVPGSIATAVVLLDLFRSLELDIDQSTAKALLTGLSTDSGFFQYSRDEAPFEAAAYLIGLGVNYQEIVTTIAKQKSAEDLQYIGEGLSRLTIDNEHKMCSIVIPHEIYEAYHSDDESKSELLTGYLSSVKDTSFGVLLTEKEPGSYRISFRAKNDTYNMSVLAAHFGGGGHAPAAGARVDDTTSEDLLKQIKQHLREQR